MISKKLLVAIIIPQILFACGKKENKNNITKNEEKQVEQPTNIIEDDEPNPDNIVNKEKMKVKILDLKYMTPIDLFTYSGTTTMGYINQDKWQVTAGHGYAHLGNPLFKERSNKPYSLRVEYEIAAKFDTSYQTPYASIHISNNHEIIHEKPINSPTLGSIDSNGNVNHYQKIVFTVHDIDFAHNLQARLFLNHQYNKKIYIKSVTYFLVKRDN